VPGEAEVVIDEALVLVGLDADPDWRNLGSNWRLRTIAECPIAKEDHGEPHLRDHIDVLFMAGPLPSIMVGSELTRGDGTSALDIIYSGTPAHVIEPRAAKALRWRGPGSAEHGTESGEYVFAKRVHHPGTRPNRFVDRALQQAIVMSGGSAFTG
jgi:hypothetical protein